MGKDIVRDLHGVYRTAIFVTNVLPTIPSLRLNRRSASSGRRLIVYPAPGGEVEAELFMPGSKGPVPGVVVCLGVVPAGVEHPQVRRLGDALARAGLATLLYWSPAMRDLRLDPGDIEGVAAAYRWLIA
ncbi:MAG: hypothetical protein IT336_09980 [Thermomicrobiales bacterium]|nr:hypothetical protein [Thermomicrobiales bacterium]